MEKLKIKKTCTNASWAPCNLNHLPPLSLPSESLAVPSPSLVLCSLFMWWAWCPFVVMVPVHIENLNISYLVKARKKANKNLPRGQGSRRICILNHVPHLLFLVLVIKEKHQHRVPCQCLSLYVMVEVAVGLLSSFTCSLVIKIIFSQV